MSVHVKDYYDKTKWIYFSIRDDDLLSKYNTFLEKLVLILKQNFIVNLYTIKNC